MVKLLKDHKDISEGDEKDDDDYFFSEGQNCGCEELY